MKELKSHLKEDIKVVAKKKQQQEYKNVLIGKIKPKNGQILFEINIVTREIRKAQFKKATVNYANAVRGDFSGCNEIDRKEGFVYIPALNEANALKKFDKDPDQETYYAKEAQFQLNQF